MSDRSVQDCSDALVAALKAVPNLRASVIDGREINPPQAIVGPPSMVFEHFCEGPTELSFPVTLVVKVDTLALERLYKMLPLVVAAIDSVSDAVVTVAEPGSWGPAGEEMPAYTLTVGMNP